MTVKKCDRCEAIFEIAPMGFADELAEGVRKLFVPAKITQRNELILKIKNTFDLCPDCTESLKKWLETGTEKEKELKD